MKARPEFFKKNSQALWNVYNKRQKRGRTRREEAERDRVRK